MAIYGITFCYGNLVTMATEACVCNFGVWRYMKSLFGTQIPWGNSYSSYDLFPMGTWLPWQHRHMFITWLFKGIWSPYLVHRSLEATAIHGMTCCYRNLVTWQQRHMLISLLFVGNWISYLQHRSLDATAIHALTCCHGHSVTMATETCLLIFAVWRITNFIFSTHVPFTFDMHQKNLCLVTSMFRTRPWMFESKF